MAEQGDRRRSAAGRAASPIRQLFYDHKVEKGGHFAAWEQPTLFTSELRAAFRTLRKDVALGAGK
jgi:pimeloyl-ACP methyl ester carboxylesterase